MRFSAVLLTILILILVIVEGQIIYTSLPVFLASLESSVNASDNDLVDLATSTDVNNNKKLEKMTVTQKPALQTSPFRNWEINNFKTNATSALVYDLATDKALFEKNSNQPLCIASLTKLMTGLIVKHYQDELPEQVSFEEKHLKIDGAQEIFKAGEKFTLQDLLIASLVSSNNEATVLLADTVEKVTEVEFPELMNRKAQKLNMKDSHFSNPVGFDGNNFSTAYDLLKLTEEILRENPEFFEPTCLKSKKVLSENEKPFYFINTNALIGQVSNVLGSKTGHTDIAKDCLLMIKDFEGDQVLLLILGAENREEEMQRLINWTKEAYSFN